MKIKLFFKCIIGCESEVHTSVSCCLFKPPFQSTSMRLPISGQFVGPGMSRLCAHGALPPASFESSTHTEDVGLHCWSPTDGFFFSSSRIWGHFWMCTLIFKRA